MPNPVKKTSTPVDEMSKYELTSDQVLKMYGVKYPDYKAEKQPNTDACKREGKKHKNVQMYEWVLYKKVAKGKYEKVSKDDCDTMLSKKGVSINAYAVSGTNGIIITKPQSLAKSANLGNPATVSSLNDGVDVSGNYSLDTSMMSSDVSPINYDVTGYKGDDEKMILTLMYVKKSLIKECYEGLGILL